MHTFNRVSGISTRTTHQSTTPSLWQTIWPRWASRQFLTLPKVQILIPVTFAYSLSSEAVVWDKWGDERGCDEGHWHAHIRRLPWSLPEVVGTVQQVHCRRRRLLRRGLEFQVCNINKSARTKKSVNLSYAPRICINQIWHWITCNVWYTTKLNQTKMPEKIFSRWTWTGAGDLGQRWPNGSLFNGYYNCFTSPLILTL